MVFESLVSSITAYILGMISNMGYLGIAFLMTLESALIPVPSEIVMPFSGYLSFIGRFDIWAVVIAGTVGNLIGSLIAYFVGLYAGREAILKYGRYIMLSERHLKTAEKWFGKYGDKAVFMSRMMPIVRTFISLPAGIARMDIKKFSVYTFIGSIPWNFALVYVGYMLGKNWDIVSKYGKMADIAVIAAAVIVLAIYIIRIKNRKH